MTFLNDTMKKDVLAGGETSICQVSNSCADGASYIKVDVTEQALTVTSYDENHQTVDSIVIEP